MTVTFVTPLPGEGVALGYLVQPISDLVGPIPNDSFWIVAIQHIEDSGIFLTQDNILSPTTTPPPKIFGEKEDGSFQFPFPQPKIAIGDDVRLLAELRSNTLGTQDTGSIIVKWRPQEAVPWVQQQNTVTVEGAFTPEDRVVLMGIGESVVRVLPADGIDIELPIADLLWKPPLGANILQPGALRISGIGQINLPEQPGLLVYGCWWEIFSAPPHLGFQEGLTRHYQQRLLQLNVIHSVGGVDVVSEVLDADFERVIWRWAEALPFALAYQVAPGVELDLHLLTSIV